MLYDELENKFDTIESKNKNGNPTLYIKNSIDRLSLYKDASYFINTEYLVRFIRQVESKVRTNQRYKNYINYLITERKMNRCAVLGNISIEDAPLEMHHGPILTLFDIVFIVLNEHLITKKKVTTLSLANEVLDLHYEHLIQVVMLCESVHHQIHNGENAPFINFKQAHGDLRGFLKRYKKGLIPDHKDMILEYIELSEKHDSSSMDLFKINKKITKWTNQNSSTDNVFFL